MEVIEYLTNDMFLAFNLVSSVNFSRTNDRNRPSIYSSLPGNESYFPFWARKCGCAECIIASDKIGTNSLHNYQNGYRNNSNPGEYFSQKTNGYNPEARQTKGRLGENQVYNAQRTLGNGNGITVWPEKDRFKAPAERMQTPDFNGSTYTQYQADPRTSKFYQSAVCSQSTTTPAVDKTNSFTRLLNTDYVVAGNEAVATFWPWCATSNEFNYQNQQQLSDIHQTYTSKQFSRDPRLRKKSERSNENNTLTSNKDSVYQANANFVPVSEIRKNEGYQPQSVANKNKRNWEESEHSSVQETTTATWWNVSPVGQYPKATHASTFYPERSAPAIGKRNSLAGDEWKGQGNSVKQPMQLTLNELSNKRPTFIQGTDSHSNSPWNPPTHPRVKTCTKYKVELSKGNKWTPKEMVENLSSRKRHGTGDPDSFKHSNSRQKKEQARINNNDLENEQDAKTLEIYAREERIRNLKTLLVKHEQALDALRFQRKSSFSDETIGIALNIINNETPQKSSDQEHIVGGKEDSCSPSGVSFGNSLKRRWLKNWNEEDQLNHKPPEKIEKRNEVHSAGTLSEDGNQKLSNAEFTALEGLVKLSKD